MGRGGVVRRDRALRLVAVLRGGTTSVWWGTKRKGIPPALRALCPPLRQPIPVRCSRTATGALLLTVVPAAFSASSLRQKRGTASNSPRFICHRQRFGEFLETGSLYLPPAARRLFPPRGKAKRKGIVNFLKTLEKSCTSACKKHPSGAY